MSPVVSQRLHLLPPLPSFLRRSPPRAKVFACRPPARCCCRQRCRRMSPRHALRQPLSSQLFPHAMPKIDRDIEIGRRKRRYAGEVEGGEAPRRMRQALAARTEEGRRAIRTAGVSARYAEKRCAARRASRPCREHEERRRERVRLSVLQQAM